jgi:chemotaxis protein methyltransferase CheR
LFQQFADIAYHRAGIRLGSGKEALVGARISKRIRALGLRGPSDYLDHLLRDDAGEELVHFLDVISTNFTSFYREIDHFTHLSEFVESKLNEGRGRLRFWSAASSSGEEPYTMAITIADAIAHAHANVNWRVLATDISTRILATAEAATYHASALRNVPKHLRAKYFHPAGGKGTDDPLFRVHEALRSHVTFKRLNLSTPPFPMRGPIDAVMCRNVMIYFDQRVRQNLISAIEEILAPDGVLFIGHSETLNGLKTRFRALRPSVYTLPSPTQLPPGGRSFHPKGHIRSIAP